MDYTKEAYRMIQNGICPLPLKRGSKAPAIKEWAPFKERMPTNEELLTFYSDCDALGACTLLGNSKDKIISDLFLIDFDLKHELEGDDYFKDFMDQVPENIKSRFVINKSWSGTGRHIWLRTKDFHDKSRKLSYRLKTIEELYEEKERMVLEGCNPKKADKSLLKAPYKVLIETRAANSYGVFYGEGIERVYGNKLHYFTKDEIDLLLTIAVSTSEFFEKKEKFIGSSKDFKLIEDFNANTSAQDVMSMLGSTGMFKFVRTDYHGNILFLRYGSDAPSSGKIFGDTGITKLHSQNTIFGDKQAMNPFQIFKEINNYTNKQAIEALKQNK